MTGREQNANRSKDPRELAAYTVSEAAHYLLIPPVTLRSWVAGRTYRTQGGDRFFKPVITTPSDKKRVLSFVNLVEAHMLGAIRRRYGIPLDKVRRAMGYLRTEFGSPHPLADHRFETDGLDLFVEKYGHLINITQQGQLAMREVLQAYLRRVEHDERGIAVRLYPFTRKDPGNSPKSVVIDPRLAFGRPVIAGTGIPTVVVAERYKAGESPEELAFDYGRDRQDIDEAIRCELQLEAA